MQVGVTGLTRNSAGLGLKGLQDEPGSHNWHMTVSVDVQSLPKFVQDVFHMGVKDVAPQELRMRAALPECPKISVNANTMKRTREFVCI